MDNLQGRKSLEFDVVVVGAGGAGLAAAAEAANKGARVALVEKRGVPGGATIFAEGIAAAESPVHRRLNMDCTKDELFHVHMHYTHWTLSARLVRELIDISGETVQWFEQKGINFHIGPIPPPTHHFSNPRTSAFHCPENYGSDVVRVLKKECLRLGVSIFYKTRVKKLVVSKEGAVNGIFAENSERTFKIKAKSVIIATGGYGGSKEYLRKYCPSYNIENYSKCKAKGSHPGDRFRWVEKFHTGDGIAMAFDIGAAKEGLGTLLLDGPSVVIGINAFLLSFMPDTVWVNRDGERFIDESILNPFVGDNAVLRQPEQKMFVLFDHAFKEAVLKTGYPFKGGLYKHDASKIDQDIENAVALNNFKIANSWDEIAEWMGPHAKGLADTVSEYNVSCDAGYDKLFAKPQQFLKPLRNPPYYAGISYPSFLVTMGGIKINHRAEVVDENNRAIKGLYAAGICTGGWSGSTYNIGLPGVACGFSVYTGRIAGRSAWKYAIDNQIGHD